MKKYISLNANIFFIQHAYYRGCNKNQLVHIAEILSLAKEFRLIKLRIFNLLIVFKVCNRGKKILMRMLWMKM